MADVTVNKVSELAEVTKGAFFHHFDSKETLAVWWTPFFGQKETPSLDRAAALKMKESQCLKFARVTHRA
jgi:AcrR family transcriptional regulator